MFDVEKIQTHMRSEGIGSWLVYDFRGSNPVFWQLLGQRRQTSRRVFLIIPATGEPRLLGSAVEPEALTGLGIGITPYASWAQMKDILHEVLQSQELYYGLLLAQDLKDLARRLSNELTEKKEELAEEDGLSLANRYKLE